MGRRELILGWHRRDWCGLFEFGCLDAHVLSHILPLMRTSQWTEASNWTPSGAPVAGDDVILPKKPYGYVVKAATGASLNLNSLTMVGVRLELGPGVSPAAKTMSMADATVSASSGTNSVSVTRDLSIGSGGVSLSGLTFRIGGGSCRCRTAAGLRMLGSSFPSRQ